MVILYITNKGNHMKNVDVEPQGEHRFSRINISVTVQLRIWDVLLHGYNFTYGTYSLSMADSS